MAKHNPAHIYFSGRSTQRAEALISQTKKANSTANLTFIECDLTSLDSIKAGVQRFTHPRLDILMCNAGIMAVPPELSKDGYEIQFAVNHLGHALLIKGLLPTMLKTAEQPYSDVRIVILTSTGWRGHPSGGIQFSNLNTTQDFGAFGYWRRYSQSKLANIVYAAELGRRYPSITSLSVHPGVVSTDLVKTLGFKDKILVYVPNVGRVLKPEDGALSQLWAAAGCKKEKMVNGGFYMPVGVLSNSKLDKVAKNEALATQLWDWTEKALKSY